jgi:sugar lactone lactonase YvrE
LSSPAGIAIDRKGNLYIADGGNFRIRKVSSDGTITTVAGDGTRGTSGDGGPAIKASIVPDYLAVDSKGNLFIAGSSAGAGGWGALRRVSTRGIITTVSGTGAAFSGDGGPAARAQLYYPGSLATDSDGNLYVSDGYNRRIRKITRDGTITTVAGNGTKGDSGDGGQSVLATISEYSHVALDAKGNLYLAQLSHRVRKVSPEGIITTVAGTGAQGFFGDGGPASRAQLNATRGNRSGFGREPIHRGSGEPAGAQSGHRWNHQHCSWQRPARR